MSAYYRQDALRRFLMGVWAMITLVLFFAVCLLVYEMVQSGNDPLASLRVTSPPETAREENRGESPLGTREISLYFASADGRTLVADRASIEYTASTVENCRRALNALIAGPRDILTPVVPSSAKVRALFLLENGDLVIDFSREIQSESLKYRSASYESLLVYGVVNTVTQAALQSDADPRVRRVRFLIEGLQPLDTFPAHLDLSDPVTPDPRWVSTPGAGVVHG